MGKLKSIVDYFTGHDLYNDRKEYTQKVRETRGFEYNGIIRRLVEDNSFYAVKYFGRFAPTICEVDAIRRLVDGQCGLGTLELFVAETLRLLELFSNKKWKRLMIRDSRSELSFRIHQGAYSPISRL